MRRNSSRSIEYGYCIICDLCGVIFLSGQTYQSAKSGASLGLTFMKQVLVPTLDDLRAEHVLVQAWKKTASYLRQHSWYADTLELDYQSLRLPQLLANFKNVCRFPILGSLPHSNSYPLLKAKRGCLAVEFGSRKAARTIGYVRWPMLLCLISVGHGHASLSS